MRKLGLALVIAAAGGWAAACDAAGPTEPKPGAPVTSTPGGGTSSPPPSYAYYGLTAVAGAPLPYQLTGPGAPSEPVRYGDLTLNASGSFSMSVNSTTLGGRYVRDGGSLTFSFYDGITIPGGASGRTLWMGPWQRPAGDTLGGIAVAVRAAGSTWTLPEGFLSFSSCPLVYSWDGAAWHLDSGTFGGAIARGLTRTDVDEIPHAAAFAGRLRLRMTNELPETEHVDAVQVIAVDHAPGTSVVPDAAGGVHVLAGLRPAIGARDRDGRDVSATLARADDWAWESAARERDPARAASLRDGVELVFARPAAAQRAWLVVDAQNTVWSAYLLRSFLDAQGAAVHAWYAALSLPPVAEAVERRFIREGFLHVSLATGRSWTEQGFLWEAGPEVIKRQAVPLDLTGVTGDSVRLRLDAPPSFWRIDAVGLAVEEETAAGTPAVDAAGIAERAIRRVPAAAGEAGGRVLPLLAAWAGGRSAAEVLGSADGRHLTMERGDTVELVFLAPPQASGLERTYLLRSTGWYRIHSRSSGLPDVRTLARLAWDRDGMARLAVEWSSARLRAARLARR